MKTLAIKLDDELHAQLTMLGQVLNTPVTTLMLEAVKQHVIALCKSDEVSGKAQAMLDTVEAEAESRRQALTKLFPGGKPTADSARRPRPATKDS